jgi:SAM-dependent methyltransferase
LSLAPSKHRPSPEPAFDLDYSIEDFGVSPHRDSKYLIAGMEQTLLKEASSPRGWTVDVACGVGSLTRRLDESNGQACGLDPSAEMLGIGVFLEPARRRVLIRGIAEALPFLEGSLDTIVCEGALDHFVDPAQFMEEARRALRSRGKLVLALANYDSLSCRIGRSTARWTWNARRSGERPYWEPPPDHHHTGNIRFIRGLATRGLQLERLYGISMLWLLPGWGSTLDRLPAGSARAAFHILDSLACRLPMLADVLIAVWQKDRA